MRNKSELVRASLCLSQALLLLVGNGAAAYAQSSTAANTKLDGYERTIFGRTRSNMSEEARLDALEANIFGQSKSGSTATRIAEIARALDGNRNLLAPPIAPKMDTGTDDSQPKSAPMNETAYNQSLKEAPEPANPAQDALKQAVSLYSSGDQVAAEKAFRKVLKLDNKNVDAYYNLGVIAEGRGDLETALSNYKQASQLSPSDNDFRDAARAVQNKINDKIAQDQQARQQQLAAEREQQESRNRNNLKQQISEAATAYKSGDFDKAVRNLQSVANQAPRDADVQYALAQALRAKGNTQAAKQALNKALSIDPGNQLYKNSLSDLSRDVASGDEPKPAPRRGSSNAPTTAYEDNAPGQITGFSGGGSGNTRARRDNSYQQTAFSGDDDLADAGSGQLTPFSDSANQRQVQRGWASDSGRLGGGSSRLKRAAIGGLTGAAMGAMVSGMGGGRRSMMKGAMIGGGLGLLMGGLGGF